MLRQPGGVSGDRVDAEHDELALIAGLHRDKRAVLVPVRGHEVGIRVPIPRHGDTLAAIEPDEIRLHGRIRRAGRRVADGSRGRCGVGDVGDPQPRDGGFVDPGDEQRVAVGRPPVAAPAVHLLGGDELGDPPAQVRLLLSGEAGHRAVSQLYHLQRPLVDERHAPAGWVGPRIQHGSRDSELGRSALEQVCDHEAPGQREHGDPRVAVDRIGHDPGAGLPGAFTARTLLYRQLLGRRVPEDRRGVHDQPLLALCCVEHPERRLRIVPGGGAQEHDPAAVGGYLEAAWRAECEIAGARLLPGK